LYVKFITIIDTIILTNYTNNAYISCIGRLSGHLIGTIKAFFEKIGITQLRFKPAYNPYTGIDR
jgi:phenylalanyl-tRNA synthetase alpha subunit